MEDKRFKYRSKDRKEFYCFIKYSHIYYCKWYDGKWHCLSTGETNKTEARKKCYKIIEDYYKEEKISKVGEMVN